MEEVSEELESDLEEDESLSALEVDSKLEDADSSLEESLSVSELGFELARSHPVIASSETLVSFRALGESRTASDEVKAASQAFLVAV